MLVDVDSKIAMQLPVEEVESEGEVVTPSLNYWRFKMSLLCLFFPHKWIFITNGMDFGIYQCIRCKVLSTGKKRVFNVKQDRNKISARLNNKVNL